jgi:prepilin-type processing-associated H-X9-DG protein
MVGEKYLCPDYYTTGDDPGDNSCVYTGFEDDNFRSSAWPLLRDRRGTVQQYSWGSAHNAVWNMAFCDGSVHAMTYEIDPAVHSYMANRRNKVAFGLPFGR